MKVFYSCNLYGYYDRKLHQKIRVDFFGGSGFIYAEFTPVEYQLFSIVNYNKIVSGSDFEYIAYLETMFNNEKKAHEYLLKEFDRCFSYDINLTILNKMLNCF